MTMTGRSTVVGLFHDRDSAREAIEALKDAGFSADSIGLLASSATLLAEKCVDGLEASTEQTTHHAESTLAIATALNPYIGYDRATELVREAARSGRQLREVAREQGVDEATLEEALDLEGMARGNR